MAYAHGPTGSAEPGKTTVDFGAWTRARDYITLPTAAEAFQAEYVWIGGGGSIDLRSKSKVVYSSVKDPYHELKASDFDEWNYDGSSTNQAPGHDSEVIVKPRAVFRDPFRRGNNVLVLCDTYDPKGNAIPTNSRHHAAHLMDLAKDEHPWFGIEQEYTILTAKRWPLGWPDNGFPGPQGPYYCGAGVNLAFGRPLVEAHYRACLYAGVKMAGINGEVMPGQWEFQVGPCEGIDMGDHLWIARYILLRLGEEFGLVVSFDPKPIPGDWNGAGAHTNYSTQRTRQKGGFDEVVRQIELLRDKHSEHIAVYGEGNERRLTGRHETASITKFSYGVANRGASVRIPRLTERNGQGYYEDRRPAANMDPYKVTAKIVETTLLGGKVSATANGVAAAVAPVATAVAVHH